MTLAPMRNQKPFCCIFVSNRRVVMVSVAVEGTESQAVHRAYSNKSGPGCPCEWKILEEEIIIMFAIKY